MVHLADASLRISSSVFGAYEGQRQKVGISDLNTLPSPNLTESCLGNITGSGSGGIAGCDFSEYLANLSGPTTAYPQGRIYDLSKPFVTVGGVSQPQPFPNNVIPSAQVSKQFINLLQILEPYTKLESGGSLGGLASNSRIGGTGLFNSDLWTTRFDYTINQKANTFVRFSRWTDSLGGPQMYGAAGGPGFGIGGYGGKSTSADDSLAVGADYVFSPSLIADLRLGYLRYNIIDIKNDQSTEFANQLGIPGINIGGTITGGSPGFFIASLPQGNQPLYGDGLNVARCNCPLTEKEDQFQIVNNWTKTIGNHAIKIGADLRYGRNLRVPSDNDRAGLLNFSTAPDSFLAVPKSTDTNITNYQGGIGFATFALGDVTSFNRYVSTSTNAKEFQKRVFFYAQDTWRVNNKLTANLGVRWEGYFPESVNGPGNGALLNLKDGYLHVAGIGGVPSDMGWSIPLHKQFEPRIGLAYQVNPKTVVRGGYGRSFDIGVFGSIFGHVVTQNLPVLANQSINSTGTGQAFCIGSPSDNPGCNPANNGTTVQPAGGGPLAYTPPAVPSNGLLPNPGASVNSKARPNPLSFPTLDAWNVSVQRALTSSLALTVAYVGNKGTHTLGDGDSNNTNPNEAAITLPGALAGGQTLHYDPSAGSTPDSTGATSNSNLLQRYYWATLPACGGPCGWTQGITNYGDNQNTNFNALQVTLAQQTWKGLNANFNYQYARANDTASGYFTWSPKSVYGADSNVRHQSATIYGSYDLPFGKGKQFFPDVNHATNLLIGGYEFSSTVSFASGLPFTINFNGCPNIPSSAPCYAQQTTKLHTSLSSYQPGLGWTFYSDQSNTGNFSQPGLDQIGNAGRNTYFGPKFYNTDMALQKSFDIWEKVQVKFRFDAYNAVNHINPSNPGGNIVGTQYITGEAPGTGTASAGIHAARSILGLNKNRLKCIQRGSSGSPFVSLGSHIRLLVTMRFSVLNYLVVCLLVANLATSLQSQTSAIHKEEAGASQSPDRESPAAPVVTDLVAIGKLINQGRPEEALKSLDHLKETQSPSSTEERLRGKAFYSENKFIEADRAFAAALILDPHDADALQMRGLTEFRLGKPADAIPFLEQSQTWTAETRVDPSYILALCYMDTRRYDDARRAFAKQYSFGPDSAQAYLLTARMLLRREYVPVAEEDAKKALELDPNLPLAHGLLGEIALAGQHLDEAVSEFEKEQVRNPLDGGVYDRLGDAYTRSGQYQKAEQSLQRALLLEPNATGPYILLGRVLLKLQDPVGAMTYLERAVKMDPSNYMSHSLLGQAYRGVGRAEDASRETKTAEQIQRASEPKLEGVK